jgi:hypothetical protein
MSSRKRKGVTFKVIQKINHPDGSSDLKEREYKSLSDFKRSMLIMGFPTSVTYELQKHGRAHFDYDMFSVDMTLEVS